MHKNFGKSSIDLKQLYKDIETILDAKCAQNIPNYNNITILKILSYIFDKKINDILIELLNSVSRAQSDCCKIKEDERCYSAKCSITNINYKRAIKIAKLIKKGVPEQYLLGCGFMGFDLVIKKGCFIARPETEFMCENAIKYIKRYIAQRSVSLGGSDAVQGLELCAGSSAISLAISKILDIKLDAVEISKKACKTAKLNIEKYSANVNLIKGDCIKYMQNTNKLYDFIIANPPYIASSEKLPQNIINHEPEKALFSGSDGLKLIKQIIPVSFKILKPKGLLILEHASYHNLEELMYKNGFRSETFLDLAQKPRFIIAIKT